MERYRTLRAYSAGGVVFRLARDRAATSGNDGADEPGAAARPDAPAPDDNGHAHLPSALVEVALVGRSHAGIWALPKGTPEAGETVEQVAAREVREETGLQVRLITYIGNTSYSFVREHVRYQKQVRHFLFEAIGGDTSLHDAEYDLVEWFPIPEASRRLTYQNEVNILYQAETIVQRWLEDQRREGRR